MVLMHKSPGLPYFFGIHQAHTRLPHKERSTILFEDQEEKTEEREAENKQYQHQAIDR